MRADLDGQNAVEIRSPGHVSNPNGLALHGQWLYLVDSNYNSRVASPYLAVYDTVGEHWTEVHIKEVNMTSAPYTQLDQVTSNNSCII